ncbi:hypothetical protein [Crateriforma conspicua]|uniref:Tetratricopeptide repeat protein n=1 Tax=Crateriforma conspicua TaxID=2527996 RepID=A0A5C6FQK9_9PLAN|nr:hypothetical protein [Crateriforma conspicua]TWU62763.1 hypothetical protein V7x_44990 [Crateriforma conspicua]
MISPHPILDLTCTLSLNDFSVVDYQHLLSVCEQQRRNRWVDNARAVCLMRLERIDEALEIFRRIALSPGTCVLRGDLPDEIKLNYASALLVKGQLIGALDVLDELSDPDQWTAIQIRCVLLDWERSLPWWKRILWRAGRLEFATPISVDFELGVWPPTGVSIPGRSIDRAGTSDEFGRIAGDDTADPASVPL